MRFVISATSPTHAEQNLQIEEFLNWYNQVFVGQVQQRLLADIDSLLQAQFDSVPEAINQRFLPLWSRVCAGYAFPLYAPEQQIALIMEWLQVRDEMADATPEMRYGWLMCMLLLLWPVTPKLAQAAWQALGHPGEPTLAAMDARSGPVVAVQRQPTLSISTEELFRAMPEATLAHARQARV